MSTWSTENAELVAGPVIDCLEHGDTSIVREAVGVVYTLAGEQPALATDAIRPLGRFVLTRDDVSMATTHMATNVINTLEPHAPEELEAVISILGNILRGEQQWMDGGIHETETGAVQSLSLLSVHSPEYLLPVRDAVVERWDLFEDPLKRRETVSILEAMLESQGELPEVVDAVKSALADGDETVRQSACEAVASAPGQFDPAQIVDLAEDDPSEDVREAAREALQAVRGANKTQDTESARSLDADGSTDDSERDLFLDKLSESHIQQTLTLEGTDTPTFVYHSTEQKPEQGDTVAIVGVAAQLEHAEPWRVADAVAVTTSSEKATDASTGGTSPDPGSDDVGPDTAQSESMVARIPDVGTSVVRDVSITRDTLDTRSQIGSGGFAIVHEAEVAEEEFGPVALKQPIRRGKVQRETVRQFEEEADTWKQVCDRGHIVEVLSWGLTPDPWIAMEYMDRGDLRDRLEAGDIEPLEALWIGSVLAETVADVHNLGVRHLDIKPRNVLFESTPDGYWPIPKLGDWGLARLQLEHSGSMERLSTAYAAPEQFDSSEFGTVDHRTDIYQLGCVVYEMLTRRPPFEGEKDSLMREIMSPDGPTPPSEIRQEIPESVDEPLLTALAHRKGNRYDYMFRLYDDLRTAFEDCLE